MPILAIGIVLLAVLWAAGKTVPNAGGGAAAQLPPAQANVVPSVGVTSPISPAMTGGSPYLNGANDVRADVTLDNVTQGGALNFNADAALAVRRGITAILPTRSTNPSPALPSAAPKSVVTQGDAPTWRGTPPAKL